MKFNLQVTGIKDVQRSLNKYNKETVKKLQKEIDRTAINIHKDASENAPVAQGILRARIKFTRGRLAAIVWSGAKYSLDVEQGQQPGRWPNKDDITRWVRLKIKPPAKKLKGVAYLVGRKIYKEGTKAQPFFEPAVKKHKQKYFNRVARIIKNSKL